MCTGRYSFIGIQTIVCAVLSGMGYASGHTVRWSIIDKVCLFSDVDVFAFCDEVDSYFIKWSVGDFHHLKRVILNLGLLSATKCAVCSIFPDILGHTLPVILSFYQTVCMGITLVS